MSAVLRRLGDSFWLVPALALAAAVALGFGLVELDVRFDAMLAGRWPWLFGVAASGARGMLSAVATSMITVAGVVFSVTLVALSLAASTYSPRVLRTFMHDRPTQAVFGVFVGTFAYCLVVLRTVRAGDGDAAFVPSLAVLGALALALTGVGMLVYFIHHVVVAIQASTILAHVAAETRSAIDRLFPEALGEGDDDGSEPRPALAWQPLRSPTSGYIVEVDGQRLLEFARARGAVLRMEVGVGEFATESRPLASLSGARGGDAGEEARALARCYTFGDQRSIAQDPGFGVQQIVDIALRALSPGVNDPTTARMCIDHLAALLVRLACRRIPAHLRREKGELRLIARGETFASLAALVFEPLLHYGAEHPGVLAALADAAGEVEQAASPSRRRIVAAYREAIGSACQSARTASMHSATSSRGTRA